MHTTKKTKPEVGQRVTVRGVECRIIKIHALGTMDVESICGRFAFRVSGMGW